MKEKKLCNVTADFSHILRNSSFSVFYIDAVQGNLSLNSRTCSGKKHEKSSDNVEGGTYKER
jgi:hypothetical protein